MQLTTIRINIRADYPDAGSVIELSVKYPNRRSYETVWLGSSPAQMAYATAASLQRELEELLHAEQLKLGLGQLDLDLDIEWPPQEPF